MPRRRKDRPGARQLDLALDDSKSRPPMAPTTPAIIETLAELLLVAADKLKGERCDDACEDHR